VKGSKADLTGGAVGRRKDGVIVIYHLVSQKRKPARKEMKGKKQKVRKKGEREKEKEVISVCEPAPER